MHLEHPLYPADVEAYILTRYPHLHVHYVNAGVGGDKAGGGATGSMDQRLQRDVFPFKPNVVTIMLGMNDGRYRPLTQAILNGYKKNYEHIIASLKSHLPEVRIVVIIPSPFDDVTARPGFPLHHAHNVKLDDSHGGYNDVLLKFGSFLKTLAARDHLMCIDFNTPVVDVLKKMNQLNPKLAAQVIPGRVHPCAAGHLLLAQALLEAWGAGPVVTDVQLDAAGVKPIRTDNATISDLKATNNNVTWTELDGSLPMPIMDLYDQWPQFPPIVVGEQFHLWLAPKPAFLYADPATEKMMQRRGYQIFGSSAHPYTNPVTNTILKLSHFYNRLDREMLQITSLAKGQYTLTIDGHVAGTFTSTQLAAGVNLAKLNTPMLRQAYRVLDNLWWRIQIKFLIWRQIQLRKWRLFKQRQQLTAQSISKLAAAAEQIETLMFQTYGLADSQTLPRPHEFEISRVLH